MEESADVTFEAALVRAQELGITETDPSGDIDGYDAAVKCVCLCRALLRLPQGMEDVQPLHGIRGVGQAEIAAARADGGARLMLVCEGKLLESAVGGDKAQCAVRLRRVPPSSPLHGIRATSSCVTFFTDILGPVTVTSTDPTLRDTGYGLLADLLEAMRWKS